MTSASVSTEQPKSTSWHNQSAEEVLAQLDSAATGLSAAEAAKRLAVNGRNELKEGKRISSLQIFLDQFKSLIIWILIAAGALSAVMGEVVDAFSGYCDPAQYDLTALVKPGPNQFTILRERKWLNELGAGGLMGPVMLFRER